MTDHYLDIQVLGDPETTPNEVLSVLMGKLHLALVQHGQHDIGISFPHAGTPNGAAGGPPVLGNLLRLHSTSGALHALMKQQWFNGLQDHTRFGRILAVPPNVKFQVVSRVQAKSSPDRLRRRLQRRHGLTEQEAASRIRETVAKRLELPYVILSSASSRQRFPLFIQHGPLTAEPHAGVFSTYGLSTGATVPCF